MVGFALDWGSALDCGRADPGLRPRRAPPRMRRSHDLQGGPYVPQTRIAVVAVATTLVAAPTASVQAAGTVPEFPGKVYVFVGENTSLSQLTMKNAPFQLGNVKPNSAWFSNYWGISHYSTSNYMAMTSGTFDRCDQLDEKPKTCNHRSRNIFGMLEDVPISWAAWNESMPEPCYLINAGVNHDLNSYAVKHNPAVYYHDVVGEDFSQPTGRTRRRPARPR